MVNTVELEVKLLQPRVAEQLLNERPEDSTQTTQNSRKLSNVSSNANSHFMGGRLSANQVRRLINLWPPLLFSGIRVRFVAEDWSRLDVELRLSWLNRN